MSFRSYSNRLAVETKIPARQKLKEGGNFRQGVCIPLFVGHAWIALAVVLWLIPAFSEFTLYAQNRPTPNPASEASSIPQIKNVFWQPNELQPGSPVFFTAELNRVPVRVSGMWIGKTVTFFKSDNPKVWYALAGAGVATQPGSYDLHVTAILTNGKRLTSVKTVELTAANFRTGQLEVPEKFVEPNATEQKQIARRSSAEEERV